MLYRPIIVLQYRETHPISEGLQSSKLYPYGTSEGDAVSVKEDDACDMEYRKSLSLFGNQYNRLFVSNRLAHEAQYLFYQG